MNAGRQAARGEWNGMAFRSLLACAFSALLAVSCAPSTGSPAVSSSDIAPSPATESDEAAPALFSPTPGGPKGGSGEQPHTSSQPSPGRVPTTAAPDAETPGHSPRPFAISAPTAGVEHSPGVTRSAIKIGVPYDPTVEERTRAAVGLDMGRGRQLRLARVLARILNKRGGIDGRRVEIEPFIRNRRDSRYRNFDEYQIDECRHFTREVKVFAVIPEVPLDETGISCYAAAGVYVLTSTMLDVDSRAFRFGNLFTSNALPVDVGARTYVESLISHRFFGVAARVGIVSYDDPVYRSSVEQIVLPALRREGVTIGRVAYVTHPKNRPDNNETTVQASRAVAEFREAAITHVLFVEGGASWASGTFTFMAEQQGYRGFRYGLTSWMKAGTTFAGELRAIPPRQLEGARGVGWSPLHDLTAGRASKFLSPRARWWLRIARRAGIDVEKCCNAQASLQLVESFLLLRDSVEALGTDQDGFLSLAAESPSRKIPQPLLGLGPASRASVSYRPVSWFARCDCVRYSGPVRKAKLPIR